MAFQERTAIVLAVPRQGDNASQQPSESSRVSTIATLAPGIRAVISGVDRAGVDPVTARRLHEMGFDEGVEVELLHAAPFGGDPLAVRVGSMVVGLRRALARLIEVEDAQGPATPLLQAAE